MMFFVLICSQVFALSFRGLGGERLVHDAFALVPGGTSGVIIFMLLIIFILGFFIEWIEISYIVVPMFLPLLIAADVDLVWAAALIATVLQTSFLTPPFGWALVLSARGGSTRDTDHRHLSRRRAVHRPSARCAGSGVHLSGYRHLASRGHRLVAEALSMLNTMRAQRGMVTSPHHLASEAGLRVLREGGNAVEATVAMAAALAVVYPHMTAIGGDGFWLIGGPGEEPVGIDACGRVAAAATPELYFQAGLDAIPQRGPLAANTVAATVAGWGEALALSAERGGRLPLSRLVEDAVWHARNGFAVTASQNQLTRQKLPELGDVSGFASSFLVDGAAPATGSLMKLPALGETLHRIGVEGTESFYRGALARDIAHDLTHAGTPLAPG
jgi:hypothetical protein